jgi:hypothetical protein
MEAVGRVSASAVEAAQMLTRKSEEAQGKNRTSLDHQKRCRSCLDVRSGSVAGKPGRFDWADENRWTIAACAGLQKARKLEGARCGYLKVCVGLVRRQVWFADERQRSLAIEAGQGRPVAPQMKCRSHEAVL